MSSDHTHSSYSDLVPMQNKGLYQWVLEQETDGILQKISLKINPLNEPQA